MACGGHRRTAADCRGRRRLAGALATTLLLALGVAPGSGADEAGPVLHYTFDEATGGTIADLGGAGNRGQVVGAVPVAAPRGQALHFDGQQSRVDCGNGPNLSFDRDLTIVAWLRVTKTDQRNRLIVGDTASLAVDRNFSLRFDHGRLMFEHGDGKTSEQVPVADGNAFTGAWQHLAFVAEYPRYYAYLDGKEVTEGALTLPLSRTRGGPRCLGGWFAGHFEGDLDELRLYGRGLSEREVLGLAAGSEVMPELRPNLEPVLHYSRGVLEVRLALNHLPEAGLRARIGLTGPAGKRPFRARKADIAETRPGSRRGVAAASFGTGKLAPGKYQVSAEIANRKGTVLAAATAELVYRERPAWLGSSAGKSERVLPPFTELVLEPGPDQGTTVSCWGRRYRFGAGPFLAGAESAGCDLLAGPLRLVGTAGGRPLALSLGPLGVGSADAARCCLSRSAEGGALGFAAETLVEYDGLVRCDWRLRARRAVDLAELAIEVPVSTACARYLYAWPQDSTDGLRLSGALTEDRALPFRALVWLGDEARGLCWFAESDRNWSLADSGRAIQVLRRDGETVLRLNLVTAPVALAKDALLDYTFGLQATPLRPVDRDGWDFRFAETPWYGKDYELLSKPLDGKPALAALAGKGVRTLLVFNAWSDIFGYYRPAGHDQEFRTLVQAAHAEGLKVVPYFSFLISELAPEHAYLRDEVTVRPLQVFTWPPKHPAIRLPQVAHVVCLKGIWQDALADGIARLIDEYGIDGVYLDSTAVPFACRNREHGCGYLAGTVPVPAEKAGRAQSPESSDRVAPVYPIFAVREALRRIYTVVKERRPEGLVDVHVYDAMTAPALAFATSYFTGEQLSRPASKLEADGLPLDRFRTEMMGRNWGLPADFMAYMLGDYRRSHAISLLHDVLIRPAGEAELNFAAPLWKLADEFGRSEARWLPYWVNADLVSVSPAGCHASLYQHPANGILAVVSNLSGAETTATVGLNLARLGVAAGGPALDGLTREGLPCQEGRIAVPLPPMAWRLVWVKPGAP